MDLKTLLFHGFAHFIKNASGKVVHYGWISKSISIQKGARQVFPLSALLFIITVEVFTARVKQNENICCIQIPNQGNVDGKIEIKIIPSADDTVLFVDL